MSLSKVREKFNDLSFLGILGIIIVVLSGLYIYLPNEPNSIINNVNCNNINKQKLLESLNNFLSNINPFIKVKEVRGISGKGICNIDSIIEFSNPYTQKSTQYRLIIYYLPEKKLITFSYYDLNKNRLIQQKLLPVPTKKPKVLLFVMSKCPYGDKAENLLLSKLIILSKKGIIDFKPMYIIYPTNCNNNTIKVGNNCYTSLHGKEELLEDFKEICILNEYGLDKYRDFVLKVNNKCKLENLTNCSKEIEKELNIDPKKIENCIKTKLEKLILNYTIMANPTSFGQFGSPTLLINDAPLQGIRSIDQYKEFICESIDDKFKKKECYNLFKE